MVEESKVLVAIAELSANVKRSIPPDSMWKKMEEALEAPTPAGIEAAIQRSMPQPKKSVLLLIGLCIAASAWIAGRSQVVYVDRDGGAECPTTK